MKDKDTHILEEAYTNLYKENSDLDNEQLIYDELLTDYEVTDDSTNEEWLVGFETSCSVDTLKNFTEPARRIRDMVEDSDFMSQMMDEAGMSEKDDNGDKASVGISKFNMKLDGDKVNITGEITVEYNYLEPPERDWDSEAKGRREDAAMYDDY